MEYQDLVKWTYLRTWSFDKKLYTEAVNKALETGTDNQIKVVDYPSRPVPEEDLNKFTYLALRIKQDVAETAGSSLNELSCIVRNLVPKYSLSEHKWLINEDDIEEEYDYYYYDKDENGNKRINKLPLVYGDERVANYYSWRSESDSVYVKNKLYQLETHTIME